MSIFFIYIDISIWGGAKKISSLSVPLRHFETRKPSEIEKKVSPLDVAESALIAHLKEGKKNPSRLLYPGKSANRKIYKNCFACIGARIPIKRELSTRKRCHHKRSNNFPQDSEEKKDSPPPRGEQREGFACHLAYTSFSACRCQ